MNEDRVTTPNEPPAPTSSPAWSLSDRLSLASTAWPLVTAVYYIYIRYTIALFYKPMGLAPEDVGLSQTRLIATAAAFTAVSALVMIAFVYMVTIFIHFFRDETAVESLMNWRTALALVGFVVLFFFLHARSPTQTTAFMNGIGSLLTLGTSWGPFPWFIAFFAAVVALLFVGFISFLQQKTPITWLRPTMPYAGRLFMVIGGLVVLGPLLRLPSQSQHVADLFLERPNQFSNQGDASVGSSIGIAVAFTLIDFNPTFVRLKPVGSDVAGICQDPDAEARASVSVVGSHDGTTYVLIRGPKRLGRVVSFPSDKYVIQRPANNADNKWYSPCL